MIHAVKFIGASYAHAICNLEFHKYYEIRGHSVHTLVTTHQYGTYPYEELI